MSVTSQHSLAPLPADLAEVAKLIAPKETLLDVGCGSGELLAHLAKYKQVKGRGLDSSPNAVSKAIARELSVVHGDIDLDLPYYPDNAYDTVVCIKTLQATAHPYKVLGELTRVGRRVIVSVPNFGYWRNRAYLGLKGRMPMSKTLTHQWYETPNIHFCTLTDMIELCQSMNLKITKQLWLDGNGNAHNFNKKSLKANWLGQEGIFVVEK